MRDAAMDNRRCLDPEDIVQILPATDWYAQFRYPERDEFVPLCAWALQRDGDVVGLVADDGSGSACARYDVSPFDRYVFRPDLAARGDRDGCFLERRPFVVNNHAQSML